MKEQEQKEECVSFPMLSNQRGGNSHSPKMPLLQGQKYAYQTGCMKGMFQTAFNRTVFNTMSNVSSFPLPWLRNGTTNSTYTIIGYFDLRPLVAYYQNGGRGKS